MRSSYVSPVQRRVFVTVTVVALLFVGTGHLPSNAQAPGASSEVPDLSGIWKRAERTDVLDPLQLNARAEALRGVLDERAYPKYDCVAATMPRIVTDSYNFQIQQQAAEKVMDGFFSSLLERFPNDRRIPAHQIPTVFLLITLRLR